MKSWLSSFPTDYDSIIDFIIHKKNHCFCALGLKGVYQTALEMAMMELGS